LDNGAMRFYPRHAVNYATKQYTEFATEFLIERDGNLYYDEATQILVPEKMKKESWRGFGQTCRVKSIGSAFFKKGRRIECVSENDGNLNHSFTFDDSIGVTEFSHPCPSFSREECTYNLVSREGIFSRAMRQRVKAAY
jgi:hypothetical protein